MVQLYEKIKDTAGGFHSWWKSDVGIIRKPNSAVEHLVIEPKTKMKLLFKTLGWRFLRGFIAGAAGIMATLVPFGGQSLNDLTSWLVLLSIAIAGGGISGGLLAVGKYLREKGIYNLPF